MPHDARPSRSVLAGTRGATTFGRITALIAATMIASALVSSASVPGGTADQLVNEVCSVVAAVTGEAGSCSGGR